MPDAPRPVATLIGGAARNRPAAPARIVRVALLDEREVALRRTSAWLADHAPDLDVALIATSWPELVRSPAFPTEVVVLDVQPGEPVPIEARVRTCRASGAKVLVRADPMTEEVRVRVLAAGAEAVLGTGEPLDRLADAIREAVGTDAAPTDWTPRPAAPPQRPQLSAGEEQALKLYASGCSTPQVAEAMHVRFETAKTYLRRVRDKYAKVDRPASRREDLVRRAVEDGYLS